MPEKNNQPNYENNHSDRQTSRSGKSQNNQSKKAISPTHWSHTSSDSENVALVRFSERFVYFSDAVKLDSYWLLRLLGYGFLLLGLFDYIAILIPPQLTNPVWEFQTFGSLVEHVLAPLLGLLFIFYRPQCYVGKREIKILNFLSWISLVIGILYLLMLPLASIDTWRIYRANEAQVNAQVVQSSQQLQNIKRQLQSAKSDEEIRNLVNSINTQSRAPKIENPQEFKNKFLSQISQEEQNLQNQSEVVITNRKLQLIKDAVKWILGALVSGALFIYVWYFSTWARIPVKEQ